MMPAMIVTWIVGIVLVFQGQWLGAGWFSRQVRAGGLNERALNWVVSQG
jgi:hypothetical protein